ncbi:hypothetical protein N658DRAFT_179098 [Parathielavia hyrcaniae]|uniref:SP-RING-type domain-containing protein n=1 Tax=Parathielavia hyrcaniae TaxID=113614 RepID=A0AAN6QBL8_9PEZI|nr:hypothetical protein N658DRAFT_179098 [Parathielavia hyrcaniae]
MGSAAPSNTVPFPVTDARFVHDLSGSPAAHSAPGPITNGSPVHRVDRSPASGYMFQPSGNGTQAAQNGHNRDTSFGRASTSTASPRPDPPPLKRRRTDLSLSAPMTCSSLLQILNQYIDSCGGPQMFEMTIERPRLMLLKEACQKEDEFFVVLHQLFCMWSLHPPDTYASLPVDRETIDNAFAILENLLKKNQFMALAHQQWLARFPVPAGQFSRGHIGGAAVIRHISTFLDALVHGYEQWVTACMQRRFPFLVDELLAHLGCLSPVLQFILFTSCRRRLGIPDDNLGHQMEQAFREDQNGHRSSATGRHALAPVSSQREIEQRNISLINFYKLTIEAVPRRAGQPSYRNPSIPSAAASSSQQMGGANRSPSAQRPQPLQIAVQRSQPASVQLPQQHQGGSSPYSMPHPFSPAPSQPSTAKFNPQTASPVLNRGDSTQITLPNASIPMARQQRHNTVPSPAQLQPRVVGSNVSNQQSQVLPSQYLFHRQQALASGLPPLSPQQFNQHHYERNLQAATVTSPTQGSLPAIRPMPPSAPQASRVVQSTPNIPPQQAPYVWTQGAQSLPIPRGHVANGVQPGPTLAAQPTAQQTPQRDTPRQLPRTATEPLLPPLGTVIGRPDWPYDPTDRKAVLMSLHQAHVRSPKRVMKNGETERFYQAVKSLPVGPVPVVPKKTMYEFRFEVTDEQFALAATKSSAHKGLLPVIEHFNGALRWRIRCCALPSSPKTPTEEQWVTQDMSWPSHIHMTLNGKVLYVRRQPHNGKDLPTEVTDFVVRGTNVLMVVIHGAQGEGHKNHHLAVEVLETLSHSTIVNAIWSKGVLPEQDTLQTIKQRLTSSVDDEVAFDAPDLSIDLADPFSATIFKTPARGAACTHMECFDLENWLNTRPAKPAPGKCTHTKQQGSGPCTCPNSAGYAARGTEPSNPDKWRCPICSGDARPCSLRIDLFLSGVRAQLEQEGKLRAKSMRVKADGSWSVVVDDEGEEDGGGGGGEAGSDGEGPAAAAARWKSRGVAAAAAAAVRASVGLALPVRREVEVIEID